MKHQKSKPQEEEMRWIFNPFGQSILSGAACKCRVEDPVLPCEWVTDFLVVVKPPKK